MSDQRHYNGVPALCCLPGAWDWYCTGDNARCGEEPLPEQVIDIAAAANVDPHRLWGDLANDGWEMHDQGLADEAARRVAAEGVRLP